MVVHPHHPHHHHENTTTTHHPRRRTSQHHLPSGSREVAQVLSTAWHTPPGCCPHLLRSSYQVCVPQVLRRLITITTTMPRNQMKIHHQYRHFRITFFGSTNNYRVSHDYHPEWADQYLHLRSLNHAKDYVDALCLLLYLPLPEPLHSERLVPFYKHSYRSDGPLPPALSLLLIDRKPNSLCCQHVMCSVTVRSVQGKNLWHYCGKPTAPGSTRCNEHQAY